MSSKMHRNPWRLLCLACQSKGTLRPIMTGETEALSCDLCECRIPVVEGVPDFLAELEDIAPTARVFERQWALAARGWFETEGVTYNLQDEALMRKTLGPFLDGPEGRGKTVLDAGCGKRSKLAAAARLFPETEFIGVDTGTQLFRRVGDSEPDNLRFVRANIEELPLPSHSIDLVICHGVLHHLSRQEEGFAELTRVCRDGAAMSLWLYPHTRDLPPGSFARRCFTTYYLARRMWGGQAWRLGPWPCFALSCLTIALLAPWLLIEISPRMHRELARFEGAAHRPRSLTQRLRSAVFAQFDNLIPEIQTRYRVEDVQSLVATRPGWEVVSYRDSPDLFPTLAAAGFFILRHHATSPT